MEDSFFRFPSSLAPLFSSRNANAKETYGLLEHLRGTWIGDKGWNMMCVPIPGTSVKDLAFKVLLRPYLETMTFSLAGLAPNRGSDAVQDNYAIKYDLDVVDLLTKEGMHTENGLFLNQTNETSKNQKVVRQAAIPHGNSVLAIGNVWKDEGIPFIEEANIEALNKLFTGEPDFIKGDPRIGYDEEFRLKAQTEIENLGPGFQDFHPKYPLNALVDTIRKQEKLGYKVLNTITIDVDTKTEGGGIINTPFIKRNADAPNFRSIFWIEEIQVPTGEVFMQLQYAQVTEIIFPVDGEEVVNWPHININTLVKIKD